MRQNKELWVSGKIQLGWRAVLLYIYGSKSAGREKSALNGTNQASLGDPTDLGLMPTWKSIVCPPAQGFPASWDARKRVQERVKFQENPGNLYFQKTAENRLKCGKFKKIRPLLL